VTCEEVTTSTISDLWSRVRPQIAGASSLEEAGQALAMALYRRFGELILLARVFVTVPFGQLPGAEQRSVRELAAAGRAPDLTDSVPVLSLLGTDGEEQDWQDRRQSKGHLGIPLSSTSVVSAAPMISRLLNEMGVPIEWADSHDPQIILNAIGSTAGLFFVKNAATATDTAGRKIIPARDFVDKYGVKSVCGTGGAYSTGQIVVIVLFWRDVLSRAVAERFVALASLFITETSRLVDPAKIFTPATWLEHTVGGAQLAVLDLLFDGVYVVNASRRIVFWNRGAERITGYGAQEVIGRSCADNILNHMDENGRLLCLGLCPVTQTMQSGEPHTARVYVLHKSGARLLVEAHVAPVRDETGRVVAAIEVFRDISREEEFRLLQEKFNRLISPHVSTATLKGVGEEARSGVVSRLEEREATVMFVDIVGFTSFAERHPTNVTVMMLNQFFTCCADGVGSWNGDIDKLIGDRVMAVFTDANDAIAAGEAILAGLNERQARLGEERIDVRIGISSGRVLEGNIGAEGRKDRTVIGDPVNVADRITTVAEPNALWVSEATWSRLRKPDRFEPCETLYLKGKRDDVRVFRLRVWTPPRWIVVAAETGIGGADGG